MFRNVSKIILISLLATSVAFTFTRQLPAQTPPTGESPPPNEPLPPGYEPLDEDARSIQQKVDEQLNDFLNSIRSVITEQYSPSFNATLLQFLKEYREYLTDYFRAINEMEPVTGSDAIGSVDDILKEKLGFTTRDLNKKAERLYRILNYNLIPVLKVKIEQDSYKKNNGPNFKEKYKGLKLSEIVDKLEKQLTAQEKTYIKYKDKILENAQVKLSQKARAYVNGTEGDDETSKVSPKSFWGFLIADEAFQYGLQDLEVQRMVSVLDASNKQKEFITDLSKIESRTDIESGEKARVIEGTKAYLSFLEEQNGQFHNQIKSMMSKSTLIKAHVGSAISMYLSIIIKDLFNMATNGRFLEEKQKTLYVDKSGNKITYRKFGENLFERYIDLRHEEFYRTHIPLVSFVVAAGVTGMTVPSSLANKFYGLFDKTAYGYGGKLMRGMVGYPISTFITMGVGMQVSQAVAQTILLRHEILLNNPGIKDIKNTKENIELIKDNLEVREIKELIADIMTESNLSEGAAFSTTKSGTSFVVSSIAWDITKAIPRYYLKMRKLNKNKCSYSYKDIIEMIKQDMRQPTTLQRVKKSWLARKSIAVGNGAVIFIGQQFIENYLLNNMFSGHLAVHEKILDEYYARLMKAELGLFTKRLLKSKGDIEGIHKVYDDIGGLIFLDKLVEGLRAEDEKVKICFNYTETTSCLESMYAMILNPGSIEWKRYFSQKEYYGDKTVRDRLKENLLKSDSSTKPEILGKLVNGSAKMCELNGVEVAKEKLRSDIEAADVTMSISQLDFVVKLMSDVSECKSENNVSPDLTDIKNLITKSLTGLNTKSYDEAVNGLFELLKNDIPKNDNSNLEDKYIDLRVDVMKAIASTFFKRIDKVCGDKRDKFIQELGDIKFSIIINDDISFASRNIVIDIVKKYYQDVEKQKNVEKQKKH